MRRLSTLARTFLGKGIFQAQGGDGGAGGRGTVPTPSQESKQLTRNLGQEIEKQNEKVLSLVGAVLQPEEN